jgi:hypothetical protein
MFSRKISSIILIALALFITTINAKKAHVLSIHEDFFNNYHLFFDPTKIKSTHFQSLSHYSHPSLQDNVINQFTIKQKIETIGKKVIEKIVNETLNKEIELATSHYVFYHGCRIDFLLFQDLLKFVVELHANKTLQDFFFLRIPTKDFSKYASTQEFLNAVNYDVNDSIDPDRQYLLSVNPALFGNTIYRKTSSAFCYFLESKAAFSINSLNMIANIFDHYHLTKLYNKYFSKISELYNLLTDYESKKTGILMQIFIPKTDVNEIIYRSMPRGVPYYSKYFGTKASSELNSYQSSNIQHFTAQYVDEMQFRILMSNNYMLNKNNNSKKEPIKMFRYFNETPLIKKYFTKLKQLKNKIKQDIKKLMK